LSEVKMGSSTKTGVDLEAIRGAHMLEQKYAGECCDQDDQPFPCDAVALLDEVDELRAENERLRAAAQAVVDCSLLENACEHVRALRQALGRDG
jgi:hypothetical protein